ncbi:DMT family transporter [Marinihelvus fidelis]|uniref:DMT family transporter n=1 Tax=Marinihelvus fidelis TaxID=2613842 RepID=A0A5N0TE35_9GAMM|nr:DMT family transporter [Marinihelvus fidelis]KAA9133285.1 DMT family transporter [Marinihelvus fidelis]
MPPSRLVAISILAMLAFAGNSLLCRVALAGGAIDAATFTLVRLASGAAFLAVLVFPGRIRAGLGGDWISAATLFIYAAGFSFAYLELAAAMGALILFGAVQLTMIGYGLWVGERANGYQVIGVLLAAGGLVWLLLPGAQAPSLPGAMLMLAAGLAWGIYSLRGRGARNPTRDTAGNFIRATLIAAPLGLVMIRDFDVDATGIGYAIASGALASGLGYAIWYMALPHLRAMSAAIMQLSVPVLTAAGGVLLLGEAVSTRLVLASVAILGGVALFLVSKRKAAPKVP